MNLSLLNLGRILNLYIFLYILYAFRMKPQKGRYGLKTVSKRGRNGRVDNRAGSVSDIGITIGSTKPSL